MLIFPDDVQAFYYVIRPESWLHFNVFEVSKYFLAAENGKEL